MDDWSRGALIHVAACPACGVASIACEYVRRDDALVMPDVWRMVRCAGCNSIYLVDRPDDESLPRAYADYYTHEIVHDDLASGEATGLIASLINGYLNVRFGMKRSPAVKAGAWLFAAIPPLRMKLDVYGRHVPRPLCNANARLLDVGCGNGAFLSRAREMGIEVRGCDPDPSAVSACRKLGLDVIAGDVWSDAFTPGSFDYITSSHVIEHVADPARVLARLHELLKPGGCLWLALPNPMAPSFKLFGSACSQLHPPFHLLIPSQRVLQGWLCSSGFSEVRLIRRGAISPSLWRESIRIAAREGIVRSRRRLTFAHSIGHVLSSLRACWGEETVVTAFRRR